MLDKIRIRLIANDEQVIPTQGTTGSAGWDLKASIPAPYVLQPGASFRVLSGFAMEIPSGYFGLVCPRSGLATKHKVTVLNAPGVIDSDYRGEMSVTLINLGTEPYTIQPYERVGQLVLVPFLHVLALTPVIELTQTDRGSNGFGSTGKV